MEDLLSMDAPGGDIASETSLAGIDIGEGFEQGLLMR
jgi:hypothetical protein